MKRQPLAPFGHCKVLLGFCLFMLLNQAHTSAISVEPFTSGNPEGVKVHKPLDFLSSIKTDPKPGGKVYDHICAVCHDPEPMIALGAPRIGIAADWAHRRKAGLDSMLNNLINGLNSMPPRGGCFECSDEHLKAAIEFMLPPP